MTTRTIFSTLRTQTRHLQKTDTRGTVLSDRARGYRRRRRLLLTAKNGIPCLRWGLFILAAASLASPQGVKADGYFLQADVSRSAVDLVGTAATGRVSVGASYNEYPEGATLGASLTFAFPLGDVATMKIGPALSSSREDSGAFGDPQAGAKLSVERYMPTSFGAVYLLGEGKTIDREWFGLVQISFGDGDYAIGLSRGGSDNYDDSTLAVNRRLGGGPVSIRAGWRFLSEEAFIGISVNTF